ncbi:MAG: hypothetical protein INR73_23985 [Williamsia sp.]|nr:hypothetical protein [Williamsia sp.]
MKYTQATLNHLEKILDEAGYIIRFERGTFQSGYCILEEKRIVVLNKFLQIEGRINTLVDIIIQLKIDPEPLSADARHAYKALVHRPEAAVK